MLNRMLLTGANRRSHLTSSKCYELLRHIAPLTIKISA